MAGSKTLSGSLRQHATSASKAPSSKQGVFGSTKPAIPKIKPNTFTGNDSDSDSTSSSDSDSDSDGDVKNESTVDFQKRLSQTPSKSKANGATMKDVLQASETATLAKSPTINGLAASVKKGLSQKVKKEATSSSSESESSSEETESSSDQVAKKTSAKDKQLKSSKSKSESDSESETSSASESESDEAKSKSKPKAKPATQTAAKAKSPVRKEATSTSTSESESDSSESESEDEEDSEVAAQQIEEQIRNDVKSVKSQPPRGQSSSSEEPRKKKTKRSEPTSEDEDGDIEMMDQSLALTNGGNASKLGDVPEFVAPDFHLRKLDGSINAADVAKFFSKAQMEGKQVWYITAPATLPVTVVQDLTIPMDQAHKGMPVLSHNGDDYRMAFDNPAASSSFRLLIPNKKGEEYSLLERPVNQTMHFTRSETFPPGGPASMTTTQTVSTTKPARPQPEGLRARYTPLGVPSPKPTITAPSKNKAIASVAAKDGTVTSTPSKSSSKKKRKHRDDGEDGPDASAFTPVQKDSAAPGSKTIPAEKTTKKQKTNTDTPRKETPIVPPQMFNASSRSNSMVSASQPVARSRTSMSPGAALPVTQAPSTKRTPILPPTIPKPTGTGQSSPVKEREKQMKKLDKERKKAEKEATKSPKKTIPKKMTQVLPPQFDSRGQPLKDD